MGTTFKAVVYADNKKKDGTYNLKIRVTHNRRSLKVSTNIYVFPDDLGRKLQIKNQEIIDLADDLIRRWRYLVNRLGIAAEVMDVKQIVQYIKESEITGEGFHLDFIEYGRKVAASKSKGTARSYDTSLNALKTSLRSQIVTSNKGGVRYMPFAFTEQGVAMLSSVLRSETAIQVNIAIMRAFVAMRNYITTTTQITAELSEIRAKLALLERADAENAEAVSDLSEDMRKELDNIYQAIAALSIHPQRTRNPIGYKKPEKE